MKKNILKIVVYVIIFSFLMPQVTVLASDAFDYSNFKYYITIADRTIKFDNEQNGYTDIYGFYTPSREYIHVFSMSDMDFGYFDRVQIFNDGSANSYDTNIPVAVGLVDHPFVGSNIVIFQTFEAFQKYKSGEPMVMDDIAYIPIGKMLDENGKIVVSPYTYEFNSSIPNVEDLMIKKDALYRTDWGMVVGESRSKYDVTWQIPSGNYYMEISLQSKFDTKTRRWKYQTFDYCYPVTRIVPESGKWDFNINTLGSQCLKTCWSDIDTGSWVAVPITEMYFRYVKLDTATRKALHGSWTRFDFASGSSGIIETKRDVVNTVETKDPVTGEVTYVDTPIDGNETTYIGDEGKEVDEDQSFDGTMWDMQGRLNTVIDSIKDLGTMVGAVPTALASLLTFMPAPIWALISLGIATLIAISIWHNLRG